MSFKIYTKTGDKGTTALIGGTRIPKSHIRIEAYGTVDELNSWLGIIADQLGPLDQLPLLKEIQNRLFVVGSSLACDPDKDTKMIIPDLLEEDVNKLENSIDWMNERLPELKNFILPGGHITASQIHVARCVCRRAERIVVGMTQHQEPVEDIVIRYLNRLSDFLFVLARFVVHQHDGKEELWEGRKK